ncbi:hypothetical protein GCM10009853_069650 [Glycomyces scopariae]|uniref:YbaB/EbfC DNA-binding family protein n=1 Tax=Glycomyces sambucus TaxID=380244 RepID=A0A1G9KQV6_9ACTN|nr:hypothetical protein [Glycomyces sambucus]SDL52230.1 hypothetical protein SAMN05216298_4210 [Glycomyces sambucus]
MFSQEQIAQQLADARAELGSAAAAVKPVEAVTVQDDKGRIRITIGADGRLSELYLNARAIRDGSEDLGPRIMELVNQGLDQRAREFDTGDEVPDLDAVNQRLADLQDRSLRQFHAMTDSIDQVMTRLHGSR